MVVRLLTGDALTMLATLPDESVQLCVTSPPYAFLRSYLPADHPDKALEIGSEPTPNAFVAALVEVFREVRRVLRKDGICVVNLGDSYSGSGKGPTGHNGIGDQRVRQGFIPGEGDNQHGARNRDGLGAVPGLPPKSLLMIPFRVAMAMQADGWILRSVMPWVKRNSMPESVTDRPSSAIEYLFLFARSTRYFWDAEAIRKPLLPDSTTEYRRSQNGGGSTESLAGHDYGREGLGVMRSNPAGRSYRNSDPFFATWQGLMLDEDGDPLALVVNPQPSSLQHFASFPPSLVEPFVKAGTSQKGCCSACGAPWARTVERTATGGKDCPKDIGRRAQGLQSDRSGLHSQYRKIVIRDFGWAPGCACDAGPPRPCVVLDIFAGSGTTLMVADRLQRDAIGIELSEKYVRLAEQRLRGDAGPMFSDIEVTA